LAFPGPTVEGEAACNTPKRCSPRPSRLIAPLWRMSRRVARLADGRGCSTDEAKYVLRRIILRTCHLGCDTSMKHLAGVRIEATKVVPSSMPCRFMKPLLTFAAILMAATAFASPPTWSTNLSKALSQAKKENKMGFILLGRENCGNCQAAKKLVNEGAVPVTTEKFVIADINTDDADADAEFLQKFGRDNFGDTLPFVVITDSNGKPLARYSGHKSKTDLTKLISEAAAKAQNAAAGKK